MRRPGALLLTVVLSLMFGFNAAQSRFTPGTSISLSAVESAGTNRAWTGVTSGFVYTSPAVAGGKVYVSDADHKLYAYDATGTTNCSGSPKSCAPLWTAAIGGTSIELSSPAVANGVVYVGSGDHKLYAFDAAGTTNCSGSPKMCTPLWTATTGDFVGSSPTVAQGVVYVGSNDHKVYAFDAAGTTNCSGSPKTCAPLWTATTGGVVSASPAVANGTLFVGAGDGTLYLYDAAGSTNCSGTPKTCMPLTTRSVAGSRISGVAVAAGKAYVTASLTGGFGAVLAYDATITTDCFYGPCAPLWRAGLGSAPSSPAVANGVVYVGAFGGPLSAFDANGETGCTPGSIGPVPIVGVCVPLWTADIGGFSQGSAPAIANGVLYIGSGVARPVGLLRAFDASGTTNCSGTPKACTPVWTSDDLFAPMESSPAVANGYVYVGGSLGAGGIAAFHLG
jgi:outer membrane protein assembly factor BamB